MKKVFIFIFVFSLIISISSFTITKADSIRPFATNAGYVIRYNSNNGEYWIKIYYTSFIEWEFSELQNNNNDNSFRCGDDVASRDYRSLEDCISYFNEYVIEHPYGSYQFYNDQRYTRVAFDSDSNYTYFVYSMPYRYVPTGANVNDMSSPPEPEPGSNWFDNMWNWFTDALGLTDDFSDELKDWIFNIGDGTGGHSGGHSFDVITPSPTPSPTPIPSPTPFDLNINYPDGTTGTITGIPGSSTTIINGGDTTNNYGSDFDIFEVDLKMGNGNSVNPRDGLNSVMDSNQEYLQDIDTSPITSSFSLIPNDWFLLIGVLGAIPFIAGFISKLLK